MEYLIGYLVVHVACGVLAFGLGYGHVQNEHSASAAEYEARDFWIILLSSLGGGPAAVLVTTFGGYTKHGLQFKRINKQK